MAYIRHGPVTPLSGDTRRLRARLWADRGRPF